MRDTPASESRPGRGMRSARLAEALRSNLARRKAQRRARAGSDQDVETGPGERRGTDDTNDRPNDKNED